MICKYDTLYNFSLCPLISSLSEIFLCISSENKTKKVWHYILSASIKGTGLKGDDFINQTTVSKIPKEFSNMDFLHILYKCNSMRYLIVPSYNQLCWKVNMYLKYQY